MTLFDMSISKSPERGPSSKVLLIGTVTVLVLIAVFLTVFFTHIRPSLEEKGVEKGTVIVNAVKHDLQHRPHVIALKAMSVVLVLLNIVAVFAEDAVCETPLAYGAIQCAITLMASTDIIYPYREDQVFGPGGLYGYIISIQARFWVILRRLWLSFMDILTRP